MNCILCDRPHDELWDGEPAWYCATCGVTKNASIGIVTEVLPNLYLGDIVAAAAFTGHRLCVYCDPPTYTGPYTHIPVLMTRPVSRFDRRSGRASFMQLDKTTSHITETLKTNTPLLVHCKGGVERSPLVIAYYLVRTRRYATLSAAYEYLQHIRPVVSPRLYWL